MLGGLDYDKIVRWAGALGARRLAALVLIGVATFAGVAGLAYLASRPAHEVLYASIQPLDMGRMTQALTEQGIPFDIGADGARITVRRGDSARARAALAERGLPAGPTAGYELFDKLGPLGLTSFMQEVARVRALEGELVRSIQSMKGVKSARVHIVLPEQGTFRRQSRPSSASVVVKTDERSNPAIGPAIRHLVTAAVPGMTTGSVRVMSTDGAVLSQDDDESLSGPVRMIEIERRLVQTYQEAIRRTLAPHVGVENFEVSVAVRINADRRQITETRYDPASRVERSTRSVRETGAAQNNTARQNVSVEQNIPADRPAGMPGEQSQKSNQRREDLANYEIGSTSTATVSEGYRIEQIAIAAVVNRKQIVALLGPNADEAAVSRRLGELERLISAAVGRDPDRDRVTVEALDFATAGAIADVSGRAWLMSLLNDHLGSIINAGVALAGVLLLVVFAVRPAVRALERVVPMAPPIAIAQSIAGGDRPAAIPAAERASMPDSDESPRADQKSVPERLEDMIASDAERAAAVLRRWVREGITP